MKAIAFAPGHISGFFEPVIDNSDLTRSGSCGAGINVSLGAISEVEVKESKNQIIDIFLNNKKSDCPVIFFAMKNLLGDKLVNVTVKTNLDLPSGQGFGMSAASALSATYALAKIIDVPKIDALKASHYAEVQLKTGLGDVLACSFGGIEIRRRAGLPPWGSIEHIPGVYDIVLSVIGEKLDTKNILLDSSKINNISNYGRYCTKKLLEKPSIENLFSMSQIFTEKTNLAEKKVLNAIEISKDYGMASMCMLGNSIFAIGNINELGKIFSSFGEVYICRVDECGARVLDVK